jgi:hypothetical protein
LRATSTMVTRRFFSWLVATNQVVASGDTPGV